MSSDPEHVHELVNRLAEELSPQEAGEILEGLQAIADGETRPAVDAQQLRDLFAAYCDRRTFQPGDTVRWKQGLRNKRLPEYGAPAIVVEVLDPPVAHAAESPASPYFREQLDLALGIVDDEGDFVVFHYDGARFEPFE